MAKTTKRIFRKYDHFYTTDPDEMEYLVYWIYDRTCKSPNSDGYVGYTNKPARQIKRGLERFNTKQFKILFRGIQEECLAVENKLRPRPNIGWNTATGGFVYGSGMANVPKPIEQRDKMSAAGFARYENKPSFKATARFKTAEARQRARDNKNARRAARRALGLPRKG